jgi:hypothetical protein
VNRVYIAGPMPQAFGHNAAAFHSAAEALASCGFTVVNPPDSNPDSPAGQGTCPKQRLQRLLTCEAVALLPDWRLSRGAALEVAVAQAALIPVLPISVFLRGLHAHHQDQ